MNIATYLFILARYVKNKRKRPFLKTVFRFKNKMGLEVGGPSGFFKTESAGYFPVYAIAQQVDGVNFSTNTVWEGVLDSGLSYKYYDNKVGQQFIAEASDLSEIPSGSYDFLLSCHSLEHVANPIKALYEWNRVLKQEGDLFLVLPNKEHTFDHARPYTTFEHLTEDFRNNVDETDTTHFAEITALHDASKDAVVKDREEAVDRLKDNYNNRCAHHHVFDLQLIKNVLEYCGFVVLHQDKGGINLITIAQKKKPVN